MTDTQKAYILRLERPMWLQLRQLSVDRDCSIRDIIITLISKHLDALASLQQRHPLDLSDGKGRIEP